MGPRALVVGHAVARMLLIVEGDKGSTCRTRSWPLTASNCVQGNHVWQGHSQADDVQQLLHVAQDALHDGALRDACQKQI